MKEVDGKLQSGRSRYTYDCCVHVMLGLHGVTLNSSSCSSVLFEQKLVSFQSALYWSAASNHIRACFSGSFEHFQAMRR